MNKNFDIAWCPGCGNFSILNILKTALLELNISPSKTVIASGIGQAAKLPQYMDVNYFNGLHGRALPPATAIKASNPNLTVIAESGDGCTYGEGGNHFIHTIRRNPDITHIVHNNMVYGLTKGQASPTSGFGFKTPLQIKGVPVEPFNPIALAISLDASFVARTFTGNIDDTKDIIKKAINHKGYALIDILQPCPSFNKVNTYKWFNEKTYKLADSHNPADRVHAFEKSLEKERLPLGIFYIHKEKTTFEDNCGIYKESQIPLFRRTLNKEKFADLIKSKR